MQNEQLFYEALGLAGPVVAAVKKGDYGKKTPCTDWDVQELTNHILYELAWVPDMLAGKTVAEVGDAWDGDLIGEKAQTNWEKFASAATEAARETPADEVAHLSYADKPVSEYLNEVAADLVVHGWDLAKATGQDYPLSDEIATKVYNSTKTMLEGGRGNYFAAPKNAAGSSEAEKLIAWYGRDWNWKA